MPTLQPIKAFPVAIAVTVVFALFPPGWLGPLRDVSNILNFPLTPLRDGAGRLASALRPPSPAEPAVDLTDETLDSMYQEKETWRRQYLAASMRLRELEDLLEEIQRLPVERFDVAVTPVVARITGRSPKTIDKPVELNRGSRAGVAPGTIAVVNGVYLVGRVSEAFPLRSILIPITSPSTGLLMGKVLAAGELEQAIDQTPTVQLEPTRDGDFLAEASRETSIAVGDTVVLADPAWPPTAQAMILGVVARIAPKDEQPLRNRIEIRPVHRLPRLSSVTLVVQPGADDATGDPR